MCMYVSLWLLDSTFLNYAFFNGSFEFLRDKKFSISSYMYVFGCISIDIANSGYEALRMSELEIRAHLGNFGLSGDIVLKPIGSLSGGQKTRQVRGQVLLYTILLLPTSLLCRAIRGTCPCLLIVCLRLGWHLRLCASTSPMCSCWTSRRITWPWMPSTLSHWLARTSAAPSCWSRTTSTFFVR